MNWSKQLRCSVVLLSTLMATWPGAAQASTSLWLLMTVMQPPKAENCGLPESPNVTLVTLLSNTTLVFQDTERWTLRNSHDWCNSNLGVSLKRGLFKDITFMRKNPEIAFYVMRSGKLFAVPWSKVKDKEYMPEILELTSKSDNWFNAYRSLMLEANHRDRKETDNGR